jgi:tRNA dimethylallyltransferase
VSSARAPRAIAVVGATATGKTELSEALADELGAEIVCCDSRQVFRELEIGTGKPSAQEREARPHHLFEALSLGQRASAGWFARAAGEARDAIRKRDRLPVLVGGSGLYLRAAMEGLASEPPHDAAVRLRIQEAMAAEGPEALHRRLRELDPLTAARLEPRDRQRISRALEVAETSGRPLSWWHAQAPPAAREESWTVLEVVEDSRRLRDRIARRTAWMFEHGLVEETAHLLEGDRGAALRALRAIGYDEALALLEGRVSGEEARLRMNQRTAQLAKRQRTWFRHQVRAMRLDAALDPHALRDRALAALATTRPVR